MANKATFTFDDKTLRRNISQLPAKVDGYIHAVCDYQGNRAISYARKNAPWTDRTGNARNGLSVDVVWVPMVRHVITVFHLVTYGIWLEIRWAGRYAIIEPTIRLYGPDTMRMLQKLFRRLNTQGVIPS